MTTLGRLWSRAPLWRGALLLGLGLGGLTILYPPMDRPLPTPTARYDPPAPPISAPTVMPPTQAAPPRPGVVPQAPAFGSTVRDVAPFAGEKVPLPAGDWVALAAMAGRMSDGRAGNSAMLAQFANGRLVAIMILNGFGSPGTAGAGFEQVPSCQETRNIFNRVFVARDRGEQACWSVDAAGIPWANSGNPLLASGAAELRQRGATPPEVVIRSRFVRADMAHLLVAEIDQVVEVQAEGPGGWDWSHIMASPERLARMTRWRDWSGAWWPLVVRGFSNDLQNSEVTPALARLPP